MAVMEPASQGKGKAHVVVVEMPSAALYDTLLDEEVLA